MKLIERLLKGDRDPYPQLNADELAQLRAYLSRSSNYPSLSDYGDQTEALHDWEFLKGTLEYNDLTRAGDQVSAPKPKRSSQDQPTVNDVVNVPLAKVRMTVTEAARHVGVSDNTIRKWINTEKLQAVDVGGNLYEFLLHQLDTYAKAQRLRKGGTS